MSRGRRIVTAGFAACGATGLLVACQLIVPGDLPALACASEAPSACPSGQVCDLTAGRCVPIPDPIVEEDAGEEPDAEPPPPDAKPDVPPGPAPLGGSCVLDVDCASGLCGTSTLLTTSILSGTNKPICTSTCCTSADCPSSFVCFNGGTGGSYCVPASRASRTPPSSGGKQAGATCSANTECRSGLCEKTDGGPGRCLDTCCVASECATGSTCRVKEVSTPPPSHLIWACAAPNPGGADVSSTATCSDQSSCKNDNCVGFPKKYCTPSCCTTADCTAQGFSGSVCAYGQAGSDPLKWCVPPPTGGTALGTSCSEHRTCATGFCDPELRKCAQVCCQDEDCPARTRCTPSKSGTPYLRCAP